MKIKTFYSLLALLVFSLAALAQKSTPTTTITTPSDTTEYQPPEKKPDPKDPKIELPDVLIYGKDQYHRTVKNKKDVTPESPSLIRKEAAYEPMSTWFSRDDQKPHIDESDSLIIQQIWAKLMGGSLLTLTGDVGYWQRLDQGDVAAYAWFDRSEGQFHNSKYGQGGLSGTFGYEIAPKVKALFAAEYERYGRGLQERGFLTKNAVRTTGTGLFSADLQYDVNKLSDGNLGFEFGGLAMTSDSSGAQIDKSNDFYYDVHFDYTTQYKKTQFQAKGQYTRETLETVADSMQTQTGFGFIGLEALHPLSNKFSAALGTDVQFFSHDTLASKSRVSPYARLNIVPSPRVGLSLLLSTGFEYNTFKSYWQENSYLSHRILQRPSESDFSVQLKGDVAITEQIKFRGSYERQWMKETFYWQADTTTGLFNLQPIGNTKLSEIEIGVVAALSEKTRLQASYIDYADNVPESADSFQQNAGMNRLPYRPDFRLPVRASIQLLPQMNLALTADVVGKRRKTLYSNETLPTFALFHVDVKYDVHENITALLSVRNLLDAKYSVWDGYPETGIVVLAGARARF